MSTRTTTLALEVVSEVDDATAGLERVESSAESVAAAMGKLEAANEQAGRSLDGVTDKAGTLDAAGAGLTGALGALSSGFELIGAEKAAEALGAAGLATDFLSGVGQSAALAVQAQAAATSALATAQKVANAAMAANPIGLLIAAAVLLAVGLGVLYAKSETFREIVQDVGRKGAAAFDAIVDVAQKVADWVGDKIPGALETIRDKAANAVKPATTALEAVKDAAESVWDWVGKIPDKFEDMKDKAQDIGSALLSPFTAVQDAIQWIIDKIASIKVPDWLSNLPGVPGRVSFDSPDYDMGGGGAVTSPLARTDARPTVQIIVQGAVDPTGTARQIRALLRDLDLIEGTA